MTALATQYDGIRVNESNDDDNDNKGKIIPELIESQKDIDAASDDDEDSE